MKTQPLRKYKKGDRVAALIEEVCDTHVDKSITVFRVMSDVDGDNSNLVVVLGTYERPPSDLVVLEFVKKHQKHQEYIWRIVN